MVSKKFDLVGTVKRSLASHEKEKAGEISLRRTRVSMSAVEIKALRSRLNLSQQDFADRFGLTVASVRNWEQGVRQAEEPIALLLHLIDSDPDYIAREVERARSRG